MEENNIAGGTKFLVMKTEPVCVCACVHVRLCVVRALYVFRYFVQSDYIQTHKKVMYCL